MSEVPLTTTWLGSEDPAIESGCATFSMGYGPAILRLDSFADHQAVVKIIEQAYKCGQEAMFNEALFAVRQLGEP